MKTEIIKRDCYGGGSAWIIGQDIFKVTHKTEYINYRGFEIKNYQVYNVMVKYRTSDIFVDITGKNMHYKNEIIINNTEFKTIELAKKAIDKMQYIFNNIDFDFVSLENTLVASRRIKKGKDISKITEDDIIDWFAIKHTKEQAFDLIGYCKSTFKNKENIDRICEFWHRNK